MTTVPQGPGPWSLRTAEDVDRALAEVWAAAGGLLRERLRVLRTVLPRIMADLPVDPEEYEQAEMAAHKLAGTLGTFGLSRGSQLASSVEEILGEHPVPDSALAALADQLGELVDLVHTVLGDTAHPTPTEHGIASPATAVPAPRRAPSPGPGAPGEGKNNPKVLLVGRDHSALAPPDGRGAGPGRRGLPRPVRPAQTHRVGFLARPDGRHRGTGLR